MCCLLCLQASAPAFIHQRSAAPRGWASPCRPPRTRTRTHTHAHARAVARPRRSSQLRRSQLRRPKARGGAAGLAQPLRILGRNGSQERLAPRADPWRAPTAPGRAAAVAPGPHDAQCNAAARLQLLTRIGCAVGGSGFRVQGETWLRRAGWCDQRTAGKATSRRRRPGNSADLSIRPPLSGPRERARRWMRVRVRAARGRLVGGRASLAGTWSGCNTCALDYTWRRRRPSEPAVRARAPRGRLARGQEEAERTGAKTARATRTQKLTRKRKMEGHAPVQLRSTTPKNSTPENLQHSQDLQHLEICKANPETQCIDGCLRVGPGRRAQAARHGPTSPAFRRQPRPRGHAAGPAAPAASASGRLPRSVRAASARLLSRAR
jgi:hypothetical protein